MLETCKACLHPTRGRLVSMGFTSQYTKKDGFDSEEAKLVKSRGAGAIRGFLLKDYPHMHLEHLKKLQRLVESGRLQSVVDPSEFLGVEAIADAVEHLHAGRNLGKPVVRLCSAAEAAEAAEAGVKAAAKPKATPAAAEVPPPSTPLSAPLSVPFSASPSTSRQGDDYGPAVGSMARVEEIQMDCMADDIEVREEMATWTEARLVRFFENGGE